MHNQIIGSTAMDHEPHLVHDNSYGNEAWGDMNSYHHQTTMADYGGGFNYMPPISHGLPSESLGRMPPPPPPQPQTSHAPLPMLMMPHATWPSQLTNPNNYGPHSGGGLVPVPSVTAPLKPSKLPSIQTTSQPRKTLTDEDRRQMCQYAEDNPGVKQTDIGARFGVERSTVSKVLRHKEKYLGQDQDRSSSPIKRTKGKGVNIEKALDAYLRNAQKMGISVTGEDVKEKARLFSSAAGNESLGKNGSSSWLDKFILKNGIGQPKLMRRASETNIPGSARASPSLSASQPSSAISPASPSGHLSPSPLSANRSDEEKDSIGAFMEFGSGPNAYKHANSQSTTSLSSTFTDTAASSFSGSALSPTASFNFSPDPNVGGFLTSDQSRQMLPGGPANNFQRPRSQTFPTLDIEYMNQSQPNEPLTPKYHVSSTAPSSALESPANEHTGAHFSLDHAVTSPQLRHSSSNSSLIGRTTTPVTTSAVGSSPSSPTQEDARRAADTLLSFIQSSGGFVDRDEYMTVVRLTEKLRIHQNQMAKAMGMGGLSRIPEGDSEMTNAPPVKAESLAS